MSSPCTSESYSILKVKCISIFLILFRFTATPAPGSVTLGIIMGWARFDANVMYSVSPFNLVTTEKVS